MPRSQPLRIDLRKGAKSAVPLADRAIGNLQQWLIGTYHGVSRDQLRFISMNSSSAIIAGGNPWLLFRIPAVVIIMLKRNLLCERSR